MAYCKRENFTKEHDYKILKKFILSIKISVRPSRQRLGLETRVISVGIWL